MGNNAKQDLMRAQLENGSTYGIISIATSRLIYPSPRGMGQALNLQTEHCRLYKLENVITFTVTKRNIHVAI